MRLIATPPLEIMSSDVIVSLNLNSGTEKDEQDWQFC